jgi:hypothetical protein
MENEVSYSRRRRGSGIPSPSIALTNSFQNVFADFLSNIVYIIACTSRNIRRTHCEFNQKQHNRNLIVERGSETKLSRYSIQAIAD